MMRTSKFFLTLLLSIIIYGETAHSLYAQSLQGQLLIDSLSQELSKIKTDTDKIKTLYSLAIAVAPNDSAAAFNYANQCMNLSKQIKWTKGTGLAYYAFAKAYYET